MANFKNVDWFLFDKWWAFYQYSISNNAIEAATLLLPFPTSRTEGHDRYNRLSLPMLSLELFHCDLVLHFCGISGEGLQYQVLPMKRNSIRKASNFKLQAARARFQGFLEEVENSPVARKWPAHADDIRRESEAVFEMCYGLREDSPFLRGLNYDSRYSGFRICENRTIYRDYLGQVAEAYLYGDFNAMQKRGVRLEQDEEMGVGWWRCEVEQRLEEDSRVMVCTVSAEGQEQCFPPPSCFFVSNGEGVFRKYATKAQITSKHRIGHLLAYTIDLETTSPEQCLAFIDSEIDLLECFNTVIIKNLFRREEGALGKYRLSCERAELLEEVVERLGLAGIKTVIEWNFQEMEAGETGPLEQEYLRQTATANYQFDLSREPVLAYILGAVSHYFKYFGIGGIHFTKVHKICSQPNGPLLLRLVNLLAERLREDAITLASSKQFIAGLTWPILEGGLGFSFTYNFHESLSLSQQHESIYEMVKQIQSSCNCLSLDLTGLQPTESIYLLFTFLIARRGVFTRGPLGQLKEELKRVLKLRKQEELFAEECTMERIDEDCMVVSRGATLALFNFSTRAISLGLPTAKHALLFNDTEQPFQVEQGEEGHRLEVGALNCLVLEGQ